MSWLGKYRKPATLSRASGAVTNYQMKLLVAETTDTYSFIQEWNTQPYSTISATTVNSSGGILNVTSTSNDPFINMPSIGSFNPIVNKYFDIRYRVISGTAGQAQIYFYNTRRTSANADQEVSATLISDGEWHILSIDMSTNQYWNSSNVTGWRYDWCTGNAVRMEVDYIKLRLSSNVSCEGLCLSSFNDIRFTTANGSLLDYCIESITGTTPNQLATIWVEFDSIGTGSTTFYMYYGNALATSVSSGPNTFILYDDFERGVNGDPVGGVWSAEVNTSISTDHSYSGTRSCKIAGTASYPGISKLLDSNPNIAISFRFWKEAAAIFTTMWGDSSGRTQVSIGSNEHIYYYSGNYVANDTGKISYADAWDWLELKNFNFTTRSYDIYYRNNDLAKATASMTTVGAMNYIFAILDAVGGVGNDTYVDNVIIRQFYSTEPVWGSWGSQQNAPLSAIAISNEWNNIEEVNISTDGIAQPTEEGYVVVNGVWEKWWPPPST